MIFTKKVGYPYNLDPKMWLVSRDCPGCFEIVNRVSDEVRKLGS